MESDNIMYIITAEDVQFFAEGYLGRQLTEDELYTTKKCIDWGLSSGLDTVLRAAIEEATRTA